MFQLKNYRNLCSLGRSLGRVFLLGLGPAVLCWGQPVTDITGLTRRPNTVQDIPGTTLNVINSYPSNFTIEETNIDAIGYNFVNNPAYNTNVNFDPDGDGDVSTTIFERNEHVYYFTRNQPAVQAFVFDRNEAIDISFNFRMTATFANPRKEAGFFFELGRNEGGSQQAQFIATSNDNLFSSGPGEIAAFAGVPGYNFSKNFLGDYNLNRAVDAADYTIWRDTLGSTTDFRANGNNEGASLDLIDQADYQTWKDNFGITGEDFNLGDNIFMRLKYTPPVLNGLPYNPAEPGANVTTAGTMEYIIKVNSGLLQTSGPLAFTNDAKGIPDGTFIGIRAQYQGFPNNSPWPTRPADAAKVAFTNFVLNAPPAAGTSLTVAIPEPTSWGIAATALALAWSYSKRRIGVKLSDSPISDELNIRRTRRISQCRDPFSPTSLG